LPANGLVFDLLVPWQEVPMLQVQEGQCGLCFHFGENHSATTQLTQIRAKREAPEAFVDDCGHPKNKSLHLKVTPISGCDGFEPAKPS
jgi:hypothetical protein